MLVGGQLEGTETVIHGDVVGIELLLVCQRIEVRLDCEGNDGWGAVSQVLLERLGIYARSHVGCSWGIKLLWRKGKDDQGSYLVQLELELAEDSTRGVALPTPAPHLISCVCERSLDVLYTIELFLIAQHFGSTTLDSYFDFLTYWEELLYLFLLTRSIA